MRFPFSDAGYQIRMFSLFGHVNASLQTLTKPKKHTSVWVEIVG